MAFISNEPISVFKIRITFFKLIFFENKTPIKSAIERAPDMSAADPDEKPFLKYSFLLIWNTLKS